MDLLSTTQILLLAHCNCANGNEHGTCTAYENET